MDFKATKDILFQSEARNFRIFLTATAFLLTFFATEKSKSPPEGEKEN